MIAWITGWKLVWPKVTAPSMTSSESSCASDSTISTPSGGAGDDEVELAALHLLDGRVEDVLAVDIADAGGADRAEERNARQRQGGRAADQRDDVGVVLQVVAQHGGDDLDLVAEAVGEQRADRAVDQAGDQRSPSRSGGLRA